MRISLNWLRELVDITMSPEELAHTLTMAGFEVEEIEDRRRWADGVVVGKVVTCDRHPDADKLSVCQVDVGAGDLLNIVCGAPNVKAGIYVPVATVGTYLPTIDLKIKKAKLRGVPSTGMICSLAEVGLAKESAGIHIFSGDPLEVGSDARPLLGLDDVILDLTSTANRADALSMVGVAREVVALTGAPLRLPAVDDRAFPTGDESLTVEVSEFQACPAYIGTAIASVKIGPSPAWLQQRLEAAGVRPINNVVDVTNYVLLEWGQPLHAFDRAKLEQVAGGDTLTIGVRFARADESLKTLDGQQRTLKPESLVITANDAAVALAGVMGGEETEVDENTENLVLEAALFDSAAIRRSARSQGLRSESSARYERGVNQAELEMACRRAIALIEELAGGEVLAQAQADARGDRTQWSRAIALRLDRVNHVLGPIRQGDGTGQLDGDTVERILTALGCTLETDGNSQTWTVTVPPYRARDLEREIDLIEEIARLYGYDNFCATLPSQSACGDLTVPQQVLRELRAALRAAGLTELMHYSLVKATDETQIALHNPLFVEYSALRTEMLSAMVDAFVYNLEQGNGPLNGFEIGRVFWKGEEGSHEKEAIAGMMGGDPSRGRWVRGGRERGMSWYEAKGMLESACDRLGLALDYRPFNQGDRGLHPLFAEYCQTHLHPGRTASIWLWGKAIGVFGQLHPQVRQDRDLPEEVYVFQMDLDPIVQALSKQIGGQKFVAFSPYPASGRDLAFFSPVELSVAQLAKVMQKAGGSLLESVDLFDEYRGQNVPEGQRSLAFRLIYRGGDRTLTDEEVEKTHQKVRDLLVKQFEVSLRS
ncbi:phenylalanine--tRNA ligase subunit beta [Oxynema sp. CENA135]|uniref:phenylalanine--tRNA ligase subunit beta n=1 Tax=Oxynema sp. CENA135 TaxID=984206 RepID=UPI00190CB496|nr:phenylalanine--tRNA ligase subunit beta [Oxynema sp. CENA135]MBK4730821.1 phenylalanine--tRNA ligase subunit beta [Oxynema sp. CENA135]